MVPIPRDGRRSLDYVPLKRFSIPSNWTMEGGVPEITGLLAQGEVRQVVRPNSKTFDYGRRRAANTQLAGPRPPRRSQRASTPDTKGRTRPTDWPTSPLLGRRSECSIIRIHTWAINRSKEISDLECTPRPSMFSQEATSRRLRVIPALGMEVMDNINLRIRTCMIINQ